MKQTEYFGEDSLRHLVNIARSHKAKKVLVVTGKKSFILSGAEAYLSDLFKDIEVVRFSDFDVNPRLDDVRGGIKILRDYEPQLIVAIGGGSVLDMAKLVNCLGANSHRNPVDIIKDSTLVEHEGLPLVAVPTTAGTGSESTHFAVVYVRGKKYSLAHNFILPKYAILDSRLLLAVPQGIAATSAMDALSQAVESYWAVGSNSESQAFSREAIGIILENIVPAVIMKEKTAIQELFSASHLAGKAINIAKTTAPHAISYSITKRHNVPHGHAVALTLGSFFIINSRKDLPLNDSRGQEYVDVIMTELFCLFSCSSGLQCAEKIHEIMSLIGLETDSARLGLTSSDDIGHIVRSINLERLSNNPIAVSSDIINAAVKGNYSELSGVF
jgi:alcohol dehydrogenase class IV